MEITNKDFELVDNYLENNLTDEEAALFRIRMQDEEFAHFVKFQRELNEMIYGKAKTTFIGEPMAQRLKRKELSSRAFGSIIWISIVSLMVGVALISALILR